ncbi:C39 family peptidase [Virgibacillus sp. 179-BFC.A HS]|uniref:C39 family peptidase n=1 Tax=Tigheibacillus jepli TaxID=3035914 RepID=A0ABU5CFQ1_9BACI|nr:C39 family peptidase [Virgibacillus sp. 179-BFC.A HS]MDY0405050.1 C39 family peptidase [Virgibacillus sp. 179-BFC.A HS]
MSNRNEQVLISDIPVLYQYPELPTGCEATALTMLLNWAGLDVSRFDVADALPKGPKVEQINGIWYGAHPNKQFVGDPYSDEGSFGVFEKPILETIDKFLPQKGVDLTGKGFDAILQQLDKGIPVVTWTTLKQQTTYHSKTWQDEEGNIIKWYTYEHAVLAIGYDRQHVIVQDPDTGKLEHYEKKRFEKTGNQWAHVR